MSETVAFSLSSAHTIYHETKVETKQVCSCKVGVVRSSKSMGVVREGTVTQLTATISLYKGLSGVVWISFFSLEFLVHHSCGI